MLSVASVNAMEVAVWLAELLPSTALRGSVLLGLGLVSAMCYGSAARRHLVLALTLWGLLLLPLLTWFAPRWELALPGLPWPGLDRPHAVQLVGHSVTVASVPGVPDLVLAEPTTNVRSGSGGPWPMLAVAWISGSGFFLLLLLVAHLRAARSIAKA